MNMKTEPLYKTLVSIKDAKAMNAFLKDLCTPQELKALEERWIVCQILHQGEHTYREIHALTGASLATITRIARFLKEEPHGGYRTTLNKPKRSKTT
jgi:TrpR-related protein YerC/YecD